MENYTEDTCIDTFLLDRTTESFISTPSLKALSICFKFNSFTKLTSNSWTIFFKIFLKFVGGSLCEHEKTKPVGKNY